MSGIVWTDESGELRAVTEDELEALGWEQGTVKPVGGFIYGWDAFRKLPIPEVPFYIGGGVLPQQGKAVIYGDPKKGKSMLAMYLGRCVAAGKSFLGFQTCATTVMYVQLEMSYFTLQDRMRVKSPGMFVGTTFDMKLDRKDGLAKLRRALDAVRPGLLILDPFYKIYSGDENSVQDVQMLLDNEDAIIDEYKCSILNLHHSKKPGEGGRSQSPFEMRGSSQFVAWHDSIMALVPTKTGVRLEFQAMRHASGLLDPVNMALDEKTFDFSVAAKIKTSEDVISEMLAGGKEMKLKDIAEQANVTAECARKALTRLVNRGIVVKVQHGMYRRKEE